MEFPRNGTVYKPSVCSLECQPKSHRSKMNDRQCCWTCSQCGVGEYVNQSNPYVCMTCITGFSPTQQGNSCQPIPENYFSYSNPFSAFLSVVSLIGLTITIFVMIAFIIHRNTPIVKASSLSTSIMLLFGIGLSFITSIIVLGPPSSALCTFVRLSLGLSYTVGYSAISAKLYMLNVIFNYKSAPAGNEQKGGKGPTIFQRGKHLLRNAMLFAHALIAVHVVFLLSWILLAIPRTENIYSQTGSDVINTIVCSDALSFSYLAALIWPFVLMIVCIIYVKKLQNIPNGFNEKNSILYCTTVSFILWIVFVPVYAHSSDNSLRVITMSFASFLHGSLLLTTLFLHKVYIMLFRKEKNSKEAVMGGSMSTSQGNAGPSNARGIGVSGQGFANASSVTAFSVGGIWMGEDENTQNQQ